MPLHFHLKGLLVPHQTSVRFQEVPWFDPPPQPLKRRPVVLTFVPEAPAALWERSSLSSTEDDVQRVRFLSEVAIPGAELATTVVVGAPGFSHESWTTYSWAPRAVALFAPGRIRHGGHVVTHRGRGASATSHNPKLLPDITDTLLTDSQLARMTRFLRALAPLSRRVDSNSHLKIALRYFARTLDYEFPEDAILFATIALEAMVSPTDKQELANRVAQRAARLLARKEPEADLIYSTCRAAYDVRSAVAHGSFSNFGSKGMRKILRGYGKDCGLSDSEDSLGPLMQNLFLTVRRVFLTLLHAQAHNISVEALGEQLDRPWARSDTLPEGAHLPSVLQPLAWSELVPRQFPSQ